MIERIYHIGPALFVQGGISSVLASYKKLFNLPSKNFIKSYNGSFVKSLPLFIKTCISLILHPPKDADFFQIHTSADGSFIRKYAISLCLRLRKKKYTVHVHGSRFQDFCLEAGFIKKTFINDYCIHAQSIICITPDMETFLKQFLKQKCSYIVIPNPCESLATKPVELSDRLPLQKSRIEPVRIVFSGRYGMRKGVYDLIDAFENADFKAKVELHLFGDGEVDKVQEKAKQSKRSSNIFVSKWLTHEEYLKRLPNFDILALPSRAETFGMSLVEAMGIGLPVISCLSGGVPFVVENKNDGLLNEAGNINALKHSLEELVNNHDLRITMGKVAFAHASQKFSGSVVKNAFENLYQSIAEK